MVSLSEYTCFSRVHPTTRKVVTNINISLFFFLLKEFTDNIRFMTTCHVFSNPFTLTWFYFLRVHLYRSTCYYMYVHTFLALICKGHRHLLYMCKDVICEYFCEIFF